MFYGCEKGENCDDIQFIASWSDIEISLQDVNEWNSKKRFGKAYLDSEGDPVLEISINTDYGISKKNLEDSFDWWTIAIKGFKKDILEK